MSKLAERREKAFINRTLNSYYFPKSVISEEFRKTRTSLQFLLHNKHIQSVLVTSSIYKEGKTTCLINLAVSLAQYGKKVLIVDANLREPTFNQIFNRKHEVGLTTVLENEISLDEAIGHSGIKTLDLLACGPVPSYPAELIGSERMMQMMKQLKSKYEFILYDSSPVLEVTEPSILSHECDGVLLVVEQGKVSVNDLLETKKLIEASGGSLLGTLLNKKKN